MNKRNFKANSWLQHTNAPASLAEAAEIEESYKETPVKEEPFKISNFLIPGWKGDSLITKAGVNLKKAQEILWQDAQEQFLRFNEPPTKTLKISIFNEFLTFAHSLNLNLHQIDTPQKFWDEIFNEQSAYRSIFLDFIRSYTFRVVTIYLYKIQFIIQVAEEMETSLTINNLLNPTHFLTKVFKKGSRRELITESLRPNQYSWFRPNPSNSSEIKKLIETFKNVGTTELMKISSYRARPEESDDLNFSDPNFSHSLSHKSFGMFLNSLLVFYPLWNKEQAFTYPQSIRGEYPQVLNTCFTGEKLCSLGQSHWLAQETSLDMRWSEILCPDFKGEQNSNGQYSKYCHEIQFLTFLFKLSNKQGYNAIDLVAEVMKQKYSRNSEEESGQTSLFGANTEVRSELVYDRMVLNLANLPKKNPHHYLTTQISSQHNLLSKGGYLYVLTNQKLFVPSQKSKVEQLLEKFKVEALFNFEELEGKGEIPNTLLILKKRENEDNQLQYCDPFGMPLSAVSQKTKESCPTFKWQGDLNLFNKFSNFVEELFQFFTKKNSGSTPIFQSEVGPGLYFEFHQDAILDGMLLSSSNKDSSQVTHPTFFKNLTKYCSPLSTFFGLESLHFDDTQSANGSQKVANDLLGIGLPKENRYQAILILGYGDPAKITIELCSYESYKGRMDEYGTAFFQYYGLVPKKNNLNINLFREYFNSGIGTQIIQLSLNGGPTKLKSKLKTLLIPNFFSSKEEAPEHITESLSLLKSTKEEILAYHPNLLLESYQSVEVVLNSLIKSFPWTILGMMTHFKLSLESALESFKGNLSENEYNFSNPLIIEGLLSLESSAIYPGNEDIYTEFNVFGPQDIHRPLTRIHMGQNEGNYFLELFSGEDQIVKIFSDKDLLTFIKFILSSALESPISTLLYQMRVPSLPDFKRVLSNSSKLEETIETLYTRLDRIIQKGMTSKISNI